MLICGTLSVTVYFWAANKDKASGFMYKAARTLAVLGAGLGISAVVGWLFLREHRRNQEANTPVLIKSQIRADSVDMPNIVLPLDAMAEQDDVEHAGDSDQSSAVERDAALKDDLTQINDIGPRFAEALAAIGITRYTQLAEQTPEALAQKLMPQVRVSAQRIRDKDWVGQAAQLANR
jgi:predicted flap endonuclease-1-like 5' DNA nuclease